jgi:hypothetical protein
MPGAADAIDTHALQAATARCLELAMDSAVPAEAQAQLLSAGKRLRELLLEVVSRRFDARTPEVKAANLALTAANAALAADLTRVKATAGAIKKLAAVVSKLEGALEAAAKIV